MNRLQIREELGGGGSDFVQLFLNLSLHLLATFYLKKSRVVSARALQAPVVNLR